MTDFLLPSNETRDTSPDGVSFRKRHSPFKMKNGKPNLGVKVNLKTTEELLFWVNAQAILNEMVGVPETASQRHNSASSDSTSIFIITVFDAWLSVFQTLPYST